MFGPSSEGVHSLNPRLHGDDTVSRGTVLDLGPTANGFGQPPFDTDLREIEKLLGESSAENDWSIANWDTLQALSDLDDPSKNACFLQQVSSHSIKDMLTSEGIDAATVGAASFSTKLSYKLIKSANKTAQDTIKGKFGNLLNVSPLVWQKLEGQLIRPLVRRASYVKKSNGSLALVPAAARAIRSGKKVIVINAETGGGFYAFSQTVKATKHISKTLLMPSGKVFKAIDFGIYIKNIGQAMGKENQNKIIARETGSFGGGLFGGAVAAGAAGYLCGLLTLTTGPGGIACYFSAYLAVPSLTSVAGATLSEGAYDGAEWLYQKIHHSGAHSLSSSP